MTRPLSPGGIDCATRVHVQLPPHLDPAQTRRQFEQGHAPDRVAYGCHHAERPDGSVTYSRHHPDTRWAAALRRRLARRLRFELLHAWQNRRLIDGADSVWTMLAIEDLAVVALAVLRPRERRRPGLAQSVWLFNRLDQAPLRLAKFRACRASVWMTHSPVREPTIADFHRPRCHGGTVCKADRRRPRAACTPRAGCAAGAAMSRHGDNRPECNRRLRITRRQNPRGDPS